MLSLSNHSYFFLKSLVAVLCFSFSPYDLHADGDDLSKKNQKVSAATSLYMPTNKGIEEKSFLKSCLIGDPIDGRNQKETYLIGLTILVLFSLIRETLNFKPNILKSFNKKNNKDDKADPSKEWQYDKSAILVFNCLMLLFLIAYLYFVHERHFSILFAGNPADPFLKLWWGMFLYLFCYCIKLFLCYLIFQQEESNNFLVWTNPISRFSKDTVVRLLNITFIRLQNIWITIYLLQFLGSFHLKRRFSGMFTRSLIAAGLSCFIHYIFFLVRGGEEKRSSLMTTLHRFGYGTLFIRAALKMNSIYIRIWNLIGLTCVNLFFQFFISEQSGLFKLYINLSEKELEPLRALKENKAKGFYLFLFILLAIFVDIIQLETIYTGLNGYFKLTQISEKAYKDLLRGSGGG